MNVNVCFISNNISELAELAGLCNNNSAEISYEINYNNNHPMIGKLSSEGVPLKYMLARTASVGISNLTFPSIRCHCCTA